MKIETDDIGKRLDNFAVSNFSISRNKAQKIILDGKILVNNERAKPSYKLKENDFVEFLNEPVQNPVILPENIPLDIIFEDDYLIVLNKQKGLMVHPTAHQTTGTLLNALLYHTKLSDIGAPLRAGIVHRLDKNTSGLMIAAKENSSHIKLAQDIKSKKTIRKYLALCHGIIEENSGRIDKPMVHYLGKTVKMYTSDKGQSAITDFKVLERFFKGNATFLELTLQTGRTHQIRCHLSSINHPLIGDDLYGAKGFEQIRGLKTTGQVLQSYYLCFTHPVTGEIMEFEIGHDYDIENTLKKLRSA